MAARLEKLEALMGGRRKVPAVPEALLVDEALRRLEKVAQEAPAGSAACEVARDALEAPAAEVLRIAERELEGGVARIACDVLEELRQEREQELERVARSCSALVLEVRAS